MAVLYAPPSSQADLTAGVLADIYTCPSNKTVELSLVITNRTAVATTIRVALARAGAADDPKQYIAYDATLPANGVYAVEKWNINSADVVRVSAAATGVSAGVFVDDIRELAP